MICINLIGKMKTKEITNHLIILTHNNKSTFLREKKYNRYVLLFKFLGKILLLFLS